MTSVKIEINQFLSGKRDILLISFDQIKWHASILIVVAYAGIRLRQKLGLDT
ncbi:MAG: hypothetical protein WA220_08565 [Candidatus Nitrosopolaris sp.]